MPSTIYHQVELLYHRRVDECLLVSCQALWWRADACSATHGADCLSLPQSPSGGPGCWRQVPEQTAGGTVGIASRQAWCPDSNDNEDGSTCITPALCSWECVCDASCHLLCTSFYTSAAIFYHLLSLWNHQPGLMIAFIVQTGISLWNHLFLQGVGALIVFYQGKTR